MEKGIKDIKGTKIIIIGDKKLSKNMLNTGIFSDIAECCQFYDWQKIFYLK